MHLRRFGHSGEFLASAHTLKYLRKERWEPALTDRNSRDKWQVQTDGKDMRERAKIKVREILEKHRPVYMEEEKVKKIDEIARTAQEEIARIRKG